MSVILDALKRVQAESRDREERPDRAPSRPEGDDALLRRLAAPRAEPPERRDGGRVSAVTWAALAVVLVVGAVAAGLWWMAPSFSGPNANEDRPLLAELTGRAEQPGGASSEAAEGGSGVPATPDRNEGDDGADGSGGGEPPYLEGAAATAQEGGSSRETEAEAPAPAREPAADTSPRATQESTEGPAPIWAPPRGADLSDLSGNIDGASAAASASADEGSDGYLDLQVVDEERGGAASSQSSGVQIDSSGGARERGADDAPVEGRPAAIPNRLVDPGVRQAFQEGVRLQQMGDLHGAEKAYKRALKFDPPNARVNLNLGVLYEQQDKLQLAERHLRQSIAVERDSANAHNNLGVVLYRMGNYDAALIEFNRTLALDPEMLDAYMNKGLIFTRWGRFDDAERAFLQVLTLEPGHALAHYNLGLVYEETDQVERAIGQYETFLRLGAADYPQITGYLSEHLDWLEGRRGTGGDAGHR